MKLDDGDLGDAVFWLKQARNLVHPGALVRTLPAGFEVGEVAFGNAYLVLEAVFDATVEASEEAAHVRTVPPPVPPSAEENAD